MNIEWLNHTGVVVRDMERSLAFYKDLLGLREERNQVLEGDQVSQLTGFPDTRLHVVYLSIGDTRHAVELVQYINPPGESVNRLKRNDVGSTHLGVIVDDVDAWYRELSAGGVGTVNPPFVRPGAAYPWARKACYLQDPDGNWLELIERPPAPPGATSV